MDKDFGAVLVQHLQALGWSQVRCARALGVSQPFLSRVIKGERTPPLEDLDRWCEILGATGAARYRLVLAAHLAHATPWLREQVWRMQARLASMDHLGRRVADEPMLPDME